MKKSFSTKEKYTLAELKYKRILHRSSAIASISSFVGVLALAIFFMCHICFSDASITKVYTNRIFYYINWPAEKLSEYIPFSIAELLLFIFLSCLLVCITRTIYNTFCAVFLYFRMRKEGFYPQRRSMVRPVANLGLKFVTVFCICVSVFIFFGGINYTGSSISERADLPSGSYSVDQLRQFCIVSAKNVSETRQALKKNVNGSIDETYYEYNPYRMAETARQAFKNLPTEYSAVYNDLPPVKFAYSSKIMSNIHITGIYPYIFPEAVVNIHTPIMSLPYTICHEMAHQIGYAHEDEANFIAYIACLQSDNPLFAYSAYYNAFSYAMNELYYYDLEAWSAIRNSVDVGVLKDLERESEYWKQFETISHEFTSSVNDAYLTIMNVEGGVQSYSKVVELLVADAISSGIIKE